MQHRTEHGVGEADVKDAVLTHGAKCPRQAQRPAEEPQPEPFEPAQCDLRRRLALPEQPLLAAVGVPIAIADEQLERLQERQRFVGGDWLGEIQVVEAVAELGQVGTEAALPFLPVGGADAGRRLAARPARGQAA